MSTIARWRDIRRVYAIYAAIAAEFQCGDPPYTSLDDLKGQPEAEVVEPIESWLAEMDERIEPHQFRAVLERPDIGNSEENLRGLIGRYLQKPDRSAGDRDKLHYLLTQFAYLFSPPSLRTRLTSTGEVAEILQPVLGDSATVEFSPGVAALQGLVPLMPKCSTFQALQASVVIPGRQIKSQLGDDWSSTAALLAVTHFNFSLRCAYARLLAEEVQASQEGLRQLQEQHVTTVDCTALGLSSAESVDILRDCLAELSGVAPADENLVNARNEQVRALRATIETTLKDLGSQRVEPNERFAALEAYLHRVVNDLGGLSTEVQNLRRVIQDMAGVRQSERTPLVASAGREHRTPDVSTHVSAGPPTGGSVSKTTDGPDKAGFRDYSVDVHRCLAALRQALGPSPRQVPVLVKIGITSLVLNPEEVDTVNADDATAARPQRAIAARVLLLHLLERAKRGEAVEAAGVISFARATLLELNRLLGAAGTPGFIGATARQLRTALQQAEAQFNSPKEAGSDVGPDSKAP